jgi:hypothetical protein
MILTIAAPQRHGILSWTLVSALAAISLATCSKPTVSLSELSGKWHSDGYGWYTTIKEGKAGSFYHVENGLCLQGNDDKIGKTIAGALSDVLMKPLPNGCQVGVSNKIFKAADGRDIEAIGAVSDIVVPNHFSGQTLTTKRDLALAAALAAVRQ